MTTAAVDSLREHELDLDLTTIPFARTLDAPAYAPDVAAYAIDEANNPHKAFFESVTQGASVDLSISCRDGRREFIRLDHAESVAWVNGTFEEQRAFMNTKIAERRRGVAIKAIDKIAERGGVVDFKDLTPDEESCLREFGLVVEILAPIEQGGYHKRVRLAENANRIREDDSFWDGAPGVGAAGYGYDAPTQREYLPRGGPAGQQQTSADVWDTLAKCYYAWTHDPVIRAACELIADFILGRGVSIVCKDKNVQAVVDEYAEREDLNARLHQACVSISRDGDLFTRRFPIGDGTIKHRVAPAETIVSVITDAEDVSDAFWYVQRYQTRNQEFVPLASQAQAATRWISRTISADELIHTAINRKESDARGRGDPYPALGWARRLRDYFDAIIQKAYAAAAYQWDYEVDGSNTAIQNIADAVIPRERPTPGSYFLHNAKVKVSAISADVKTISGEGGAYDSLLNHIALAFLLSKSYLGADSHENRASALVATEPTAKHLETRQAVMNRYLSTLVQDVIEEAQKYGKLAKTVDITFKLVFPELIKADSAARVTMLRQAEGTFYISRRTAATEVAGEIGIDDYDFDSEMAQIKKELGDDTDPQTLTCKDLETVRRGLPQKDDLAFPPGYVANPDYDAVTNPNVPTSIPDPNALQPAQRQPALPSGGGGVANPPALPKPKAGAASPTSATGAGKIRDEIGRGGSSDRSTYEAISFSDLVAQVRAEIAGDGKITDEAFAEAARERGVILIRP